MSELPPAPELDDLPDELVLAPGPLRIRGRDPVTGEEYETTIGARHVAAAFADQRRLDEQP